MPPHQAARLRLVALWVAVAAHAAAVAAVITAALKVVLGGDFAAYRPDVLASWLAVSAAPALILSPAIGILAYSRWWRVALADPPAVALLVVGWEYLSPNGSWLSVAGVLSLEAAFFAAAVLARLPAAAAAARLRLPTVLAGIALALFAGLLLGFDLGIESDRKDPPPAAVYALGLLAATVAGALVARFPVADLPLLSAGVVRLFVAGVRDAVRHRRARRGLIGLWAWGFIALAVLTAVVRWAGIASAPRPGVPPEAVAQPWEPPATTATANTVSFGVAVLGGALIAGLNRHPYRHAWVIPYAATVGLASLLWLRVGHSSRGPLVGLGAALGVTLTPLLNSYITWTNPKYRGAAIGLLVASGSTAALLLACLLPAFGSDPAAARDSFLDLLIAAAALSAAGAWVGFFRPMVEGTAEILVEVMYRVRAFGPDVERLPVRGPCLVIANHAAWLDPLWLAQILSSPTTPMMTSKFYDLPVLAWLMRRVIGAIRVPDTPFRHEAPELQEAVGALDRGECIILFPEGYLRRKEEVPLRRFGRGVWKILSDRPQTPVFACWIDGGWGSYFSFKGGPPARNKRPDFRRPVRIAVTGPFTVDPAVLADHMATRTHLMERVNAARPLLGLEPLDLGGVPEGEKE